MKMFSGIKVPDYVIVMTDCGLDDNASMRQKLEWIRCTGVNPVIITIQHPLEAAGNLIDALWQSRGLNGIIAINIAPRDIARGQGQKSPNGAPFACMTVENAIVISTVCEGNAMFSLVKKLRLAKTFREFDIPTVAQFAREYSLLDAHQAEEMIRTQFRSLNFMPRAGSWLRSGIELPSTEYVLSDVVADVPPCVWWVDKWPNGVHYGNCKTTVLESELPEFRRLGGKFADMRFFSSLAEVPEDDEPALVPGSSGFGKPFLECVIQGKSAAERLRLKAGSPIV